LAYSSLGKERKYLNIIKAIYDKPTVNITLNGEKLKTFQFSRTLNRLYQNRTTPQHIVIETTNTETRERILKDVREKK
jgi:hypothetical protein